MNLCTTSHGRQTVMTHLRYRPPSARIEPEEWPVTRERRLQLNQRFVQPFTSADDRFVSPASNPQPVSERQTAAT
jgi:hypothetical protein